ncbi:MAG: NADH-quinone oxidoreductase subunit N [Planctomycetes bacterium]|nr:NADH-quinone oxidoreductase subunit N [Planctomycetota bacterium]
MIPLATTAIDSTLQQVFRSILPEASLIGTACVLFVLSTFNVKRHTAGAIALAACGLAALLHFCVDRPTGVVETVAPALGDHLALFIRITALITGVVLILFCWDETNSRRACDYHACLLCVIAGLSLVGAANDLIFLFLALELISIPTYVMLYLPKSQDSRAQEAAVKYFLLSILSSAFLLFGFSYLYGLTGTTNITAILQILPAVAAGDMANMALVAAVMIVAGLGFKVTAFPFHFYAPDVYQGAPLGVVSLLAFVPKVAGFVALLRLFGTFCTMSAVDYTFTKQYMMLLWILAAVTMTAGNVMALLQNNIRRMLAYSGVAHAGYMLIGLAVLPSQTPRGDSAVINGGDAVLFYLVAYGAMTIGAFGVIAYLSRPERSIDAVDDLAGLHETNPRMALVMALFMCSMIGLPLTAGFIGKFFLFLGALAVKDTPPMGHLYQVLALIGAVNAAIAAYYYLRVISVMYLRGSFQPPIPLRPSPILLAIFICAFITLFFGIYPAPIFNSSRIAFGTH